MDGSTKPDFAAHFAFTGRLEVLAYCHGLLLTKDGIKTVSKFELNKELKLKQDPDSASIVNLNIEGLGKYVPAQSIYRKFDATLRNVRAEMKDFISTVTRIDDTWILNQPRLNHFLQKFAKLGCQFMITVNCVDVYNDLKLEGMAPAVTFLIKDEVIAKIEDVLAMEAQEDRAEAFGQMIECQVAGDLLAEKILGLSKTKTHKDGSTVVHLTIGLSSMKIENFTKEMVGSPPRTGVADPTLSNLTTDYPPLKDAPKVQPRKVATASATKAPPSVWNTKPSVAGGAKAEQKKVKASKGQSPGLRVNELLSQIRSDVSETTSIIASPGVAGAIAIVVQRVEDAASETNDSDYRSKLMATIPTLNEVIRLLDNPPEEAEFSGSFVDVALRFSPDSARIAAEQIETQLVIHKVLSDEDRQAVINDTKRIRLVSTFSELANAVAADGAKSLANLKRTSGKSSYTETPRAPCIGSIMNVLDQYTDMLGPKSPQIRFCVLTFETGDEAAHFATPIIKAKTSGWTKELIYIGDEVLAMVGAEHFESMVKGKKLYALKSRDVFEECKLGAVNLRLWSHDGIDPRTSEKYGWVDPSHTAFTPIVTLADVEFTDPTAPTKPTTTKSERDFVTGVMMVLRVASRRQISEVEMKPILGTEQEPLEVSTPHTVQGIYNAAGENRPTIKVGYPLSHLVHTGNVIIKIGSPFDVGKSTHAFAVGKAERVKVTGRTLAKGVIQLMKGGSEFETGPGKVYLAEVPKVEALKAFSPDASTVGSPDGAPAGGEGGGAKLQAKKKPAPTPVKKPDGGNG